MAGLRKPQLIKGKKVVDKMMQNDLFSQWLGIEVVEVGEGTCLLSMTVKEEMTNGFKIAHGGITYSLADSALAFASNVFGVQSVSIETAIAHQGKVVVGDILTASCTLLKQTKKLGWYLVSITNQHNEIVASFKGTVFKTEKVWE